jgi:uncharacterized membrane protein
MERNTQQNNTRIAALASTIAICGALIAVVPGTVWKVLLIILQLVLAVTLGMFMGKK